MLSRELDDSDEPTERLEEDARLHLEFHAGRVRRWSITYGAITLLMGIVLALFLMNRSGGGGIDTPMFLVLAGGLCMFGIACIVSGALVRAGRKLLAGLICFAVPLSVILLAVATLALPLQTEAKTTEGVTMIFRLEIAPHFVLAVLTFRKAWEMALSQRIEELKQQPKAFEVQMPQMPLMQKK